MRWMTNATDRIFKGYGWRQKEAGVDCRILEGNNGKNMDEGPCIPMASSSGVIRR